MKPIRITELFANIKTNLVAFLSIAMFVSLGVGLFLGIEWGAVALRNTALKIMDQSRMHDIQISFPYGITKSDLEKIEKVEGVTEVEPGYSSFVVTKDGGTSYTLKVQSVPQNINKPITITGNLPMEPNEIALVKYAAETHGLAIGDTIELRHDATSDNASDKDGMEYLTTDTFTITALVETPEYLYNNSAGLGVANIGSGDVDLAGLVINDAFDMSKFRDGYPTINIRCASLEGISVFTDEYREKVNPIVKEIEELGGTLGTARYQEIRDEAQDKLDDAQKQIDDGEKQLDDAQKQIDDGEQQLAEGQQKLDEGEKELLDSVTSSMGDQSAAQIKLNEAYRELAEGQAKYDAGMATYNTGMQTYSEINGLFNRVRPEYNLLVRAMDDVRDAIDELQGKQDALRNAYDHYKEDPTPENWDKVTAAYAEVRTKVMLLKAAMDVLGSRSGSVGGALGMGVGSLAFDPDIPLTITPENAEETIDASQDVIDEARDKLNEVEDASITVAGTTITLMDIPDGLRSMKDQLDEGKAELDSAKRQLDSGWDEYYRAKAQYDAAVAEGQSQLQAGEKELENGRATIKEKQQELEEGKSTLEEKSKELQEGKDKLQDAKDQFAKLEQYEWVVLPRQESASMQGLTSVSTMMDNVKWAMALLFILVGLFVCYSAISRLVHEQIIQVGTKKALGFRTGEASSMYLWFSGLAVALGIVVSVALAILLVQGIMNPKAAESFSLGTFGPHFNFVDVLVMGFIELALILASTGFAIHGLLKRDAVDLLRGESTANAKERWYERTHLWQRMSLFSKTVVNNCVNDKRRVVGTLIGVIGCTALIVVAITLSNNIARSFSTHYEKVYNFDSVVCLTEASQQKADSVALALYNRGISSAPTYKRKLQVRTSNGLRNSVDLVVPTNEDAFKKFYHVTSTTGGEANVEAGGLWVSAAYGEHENVKVGDEITLTEFSGKTHTFKVAGFYNYYLVRYEMVLSQNEYREAFGEKPAPNSLITNLAGADIMRTRNALEGVDGYGSLVDDKAKSQHSYDQLNSILRTVVLIYLLLSGLMALMVLLNLYIMFVDEKKKELIVLMICGFSVKDAKAYIYRDSIVLTILGIVLGIVLGAIMGGVTVAALEPPTAYWLKGFNEIAAISGAVGAGVFSAVVLIYALRRIPRFNLTDINRF